MSNKSIQESLIFSSKANYARALFLLLFSFNLFGGTLPYRLETEKPVTIIAKDRLKNWIAQYSELNLSHLPSTEKSHLIAKQEEMFRRGKISILVIANEEKNQDDLKIGLENKATDLRLLQTTYQIHVPMYILTSAGSLSLFKNFVFQKKYFGLTDIDFHWFSQEKTDEEKTFSEKSFEAIACLMISGLLNEALAQGIEYLSIVNIEDEQSGLENEGIIAYFSEQEGDVGFVRNANTVIVKLKNLLKFLDIAEKENDKDIHPQGGVNFCGVDDFCKKFESPSFRLKFLAKIFGIF